MSIGSQLRGFIYSETIQEVTITLWRSIKYGFDSIFY